MANKRYDEFAAGTYDTAKIFLQADPSTGELEKVNLPSPGARYCKFSGSVLVNANNSGSNPQTAATITIPANTISNDGDFMEVTAIYRVLTGAGSKQVEIQMNGNTIGTFTSTFSFVNNITSYAVRLSSSALYSYYTAFQGNNFSGQGTNTSVGFTAGSSQDITLKVLQGAANDIFLLSVSVKIFSAT
jgi:hypothetical protein